MVSKMNTSQQSMNITGKTVILLKIYETPVFISMCSMLQFFQEKYQEIDCSGIYAQQDRKASGHLKSQMKILQKLLPGVNVNTSLIIFCLSQASMIHQTAFIYMQES